jgi:hypothetical protein
MIKSIAALQGVQVLSRETLKQIEGSKGTCAVHLAAGQSPTVSFSWSGSSYTQNPDGSITITGVSYNEAQNWVSGGGHWCCSSCASASWL